MPELADFLPHHLCHSQRIPTLLSLLSSALEGLLPPPPDQPEIEEGERFLEAARAYYELLDVCPFSCLVSSLLLACC